MKARPLSSSQRVSRHRVRQASGGNSRLEVTIPEHDADLVRAVAARLRAGGERAEAMRNAIAPLVDAPRARTGAELLAFFRDSPLVGSNLQIERDRSPGRRTAL